MYFFLWNFFLEISSTNITPWVLISITTWNKNISFAGWFTQYFFAIFLAETVLSSGCHIPCSLCNHREQQNLYPAGSLLLAVWLIVILPTTLMSQQDFCALNRLNYYFCNYEPLGELSCSDTSLIEKIVFLVASVTLIVTLVLVILSYSFIIRTILKLPSAQQRTKVFLTCSSHMIVISLSYGNCFFIYVKPSTKEGDTLNKRVALLITSIVPLLNSFIYTLRNQ